MYQVLLSPYTRIFFNEWKLDPSRSDYNIVFDQALEGEINISRLNSAVKRFVSDYVVLNSHIEEKNGNLYWVRNSKVDELECFKDKLTHKDILSYVQKPFNLEKGPLYRFGLIKNHNNKYRLIIVLHHIIIDGSSFDYFISELTNYYNNQCHKNSIPTEEQLFNISKLSKKLSKHLGYNKEKSKLFWQGRLSNIEPLDLNFLRCSSNQNDLQSHLQQESKLFIQELSRISEIRFSFGKEILLKLNQLRSKYIITPYLYGQCIYAILLHRYTGQDRFCVSYPVAIKEGMDFIYGAHLNTNTIPYDFSKINNVLDIINQSKEFINSLKHDDISHSYLPIYDIVSVSNKDILNLSFVQTNLKDKVVEFENIKAIINNDTNIDLSNELLFEQEIQNERINYRIKYKLDNVNTFLLNEFIIRYKQLFIEILDELVQLEDSNKLNNIKNYNLLLHEQYKQIIYTWNNTEKSYLSDKTIQALFEDQVEKTPDNIAVVYEEIQLTYKELNEKANQLAHYLRQVHRIKPDTLIALCLDRSEHVLIAILGVLKAGGAYVPIDPSYPNERIQYILKDTHTNVVLTNELHKQRLEDVSNVNPTDSTSTEVSQLTEILAIDSKALQEQLSLQLITNLSATTSTNLAYVIYTSGTTGNPKGVMVEHNNVVRLLKATQQSYHFTQNDVWSLFHSYAFDFSVWEMWGALAYGGKLIVVSYLTSRTPEAFYALLKKENVTILNQTLSAFQQLILHEQSLHKSDLCTRLVIFGGEALEYYKLKYWFDTHKGKETHLVNMYGITETTVHVTYFPISKEHTLKKEKSIIGKRILDLKVYILDSYMSPVLIGVAGEIYIGGAGLARGYLNRPDLTADRFIPNPFVNQKDAQDGKNLRLYRTGDLARYLPDGNIEFLGRIDDQVKIRGFRIELGEIESILNSHDSVAKAVVMAREDKLDDQKLVAYVVPQEIILSSLSPQSIITSSSDVSFFVMNGERVSDLTEDVRNYLIRLLPIYMVPSFFVYLDQIPLTPNGKIDRKSLPAPDLTIRMVGDKYVAPQTALEQGLSNIWSEVLKVETIGIHDDFFKLGGHSLLATQVISRIRHNYNVDISLKTLFEYPTVVTFSEIVNSLSKEKSLSLIPSIVPMARKEHSPLSFAQQRLWFLDQLLPEVALYNMPLAMRLKGTINLSALKVALDVLIKRHESLRTIFAVEEGAAYQTILPNISIDLKANTVDLSSLSPEEQSEKLRIYGQQEANTLFDLSLGPLIRVKLIILNKEEHVLLITLHHIISDGWSMGVFFKEFSILYNGYCIGEEVPGTLLAPLPIQYADFALWQREWLQGERLEQQLAYWKEKLSGVPDVLQLPTDRRRPKELSYNGNVYHCNLSRETREQLNNLSQRYQTSLFMTLLAVFQVLLYRYTRQEDIVVGSPIANRHYKEIEGLIGFFVNTLALRTKFTGEETFIDILHSVKETTLQAYQHQDVPFEQLVEHLNISRELNRNPLFQVMFALQNAGEEESLHLNNIQVEWLDSDYLVAKFDLRVSANEHEEGIELYFEYATDLFNLETIERFANHFKELVWAISKEPSQLILTYPLLTEREQQQLLIEWNDTTTEYSQDRDKCIHELFEEQVSRAPNNIAVVYEGQELTYQELNEKSNQLAHYLRSLGVGPDTLVAIAVERSIEMIVGILGILKAGGAYVPLDPSYPKERLQFILEDTSAPILYTQSSLKAMFGDYRGSIIFFDEDKSAIEQQQKTNLRSLTSLNHLAYIIYTSGSTGKPKGVMVEHNNVVRLFKITQRWYQFSENDVWTLLHSYAFDFSVWEIWGALFFGGKLIIVPYMTSRIPEVFYSLLEKEGVTVLNQTPSAFYQLVDYEQSLRQYEKPYSLFIRLVIFGGETLEPDKLKLWFNDSKKDNIQLINMYGITETTIHVTYLQICKEKSIQLERSIIGKRIPDLKIYLMDDYMNPVPIGVSGEIYIGGEGLARGYLNRFELTADRFVPNPFVEAEDYEKSKNLRLYRSGDLARYLPDGNIEFLGRIDDQVKIRGFRIELGEIEAVLDSHGKVSRSIVLAREEELEHKYLVVYVRPQDEVIAMLQPLATLESASDQSFSVLSGEYLPSLTEDLRNYLGKSVPDYMIPASFVYVNDFPLTLNGKIDRKALPAPDLSLRMVETQYVAPITPLEQELCAIWADVLKVETIGIHDNFFKLGGDSIISIQLVAKARQKRIYLSPKHIFMHPTISRLAKMNPIQEQIITLKPHQGLSVGLIPFTPIQHWFFEKNFSNQNHFNQSIMLKIKKIVDSCLLKKSFQFLLMHHDVLRYEYHFDKSQKLLKQLCVTDFDKDLFWKVIDLSLVLDSDLALEIEYQSTVIQESLDIEKFPLIRVVLFNCGDHRCSCLLVVAHHLIVDGVSWRILLEDLDTVYGQLIRREQPTLPFKTHSYQQWALVLQTYAQSDSLEKQISYWQKVIEAITPLPIDFDHGLVTVETTKTICMALNENETINLLQNTSMAYDTQINDILLTALTLAIGDWTGAYNLTLSVEGHGREDLIEEIDLSRTVGWFTSIFPTHLRILDPNDLENAIKIVKETLRLIPHKGIDYGILTYLKKDYQSLLPLPFYCSSSSFHHPSLSFNYMGQWDNLFLGKNILFDFMDGLVGRNISVHNQQIHKIEINCEIKRGVFNSFWTYSTNHYYHTTIEKVMQYFIMRLKQLIKFCSQQKGLKSTKNKDKLAKRLNIILGNINVE